MNSTAKSANGIRPDIRLNWSSSPDHAYLVTASWRLDHCSWQTQMTSHSSSGWIARVWESSHRQSRYSWGQLLHELHSLLARIALPKRDSSQLAADMHSPHSANSAVTQAACSAEITMRLSSYSYCMIVHRVCIAAIRWLRII